MYSYTQLVSMIYVQTAIITLPGLAYFLAIAWQQRRNRRGIQKSPEIPQPRAA